MSATSDMATIVRDAGSPQPTPPSNSDSISPPVIALGAIQDMSPRQEVEGCAMVLRADCAVDRSGKPYLTLTLRCADGGHLEARWWRYPYPLDRRPTVGQVCWFVGTVDLFGGERQLCVTRTRPAPHIDPIVFARATRRSLDDLRPELDTRIARLSSDLGNLVRSVLSGDTLERFCEWPAAQIRHGAVRHGLLAHALLVAEIAERLAEAYGPHGLPHDSELVVAASLLHDVGKIWTLPAVAGGAPPEGAHECDHVTRTVLVVERAAAHAEPAIAPERLARLTHAILAHHGRKEWGAAVEPQTAEAWLVHLADLAESCLWNWSDQEARS